MGLENNIPEDWVETTLGDVCEIKYGKDHKKLNDGNIPCFGSGGLMRRVSEILYDKPSVLIPRKGTLTNLFFIDEPFWTVDTLFYTKINSSKILPKYLFYKLKTYDLESLNVGSAVPSLTTAVLNQFPFTIPNIPEQKSIANVLTAFDDKIELLQAQNKTLETMAQTIFKEWFGKYQIGDDLPEGWRVEKLGDILETYLGGTPSKSKNEYWDDGSIPWINSGEVNNFRITRGTTLITKLGLEKSATKLLPKGTVVIAITGATLGQYSILEIESCFNQSVVGILGNNKIKSSFIYFWIANNIHAIIRNATGGAQQHINKENVNSFEIILPSDKLLNKFQSIVEPMMDKISNNEFETQTLRKTRDTLLPKLMSGQVRVNNTKNA